VVDEITEKPVFTKQKLNWEDDEELYSKYQDRKVGCRHVIEAYHK